MRVAATRVALVAGVGIGILLTGCTGQADDSDPTSVSSTTLPAAPATSTPSGPATSGAPATARPTATAAAFPTDCRSLVSAATYAKTLATLPLNDPGVVGPTPTQPTTALTPAVATGGKSLYCVWREPQADITFLSIQVVQLDPVKGPKALGTAGLAAQGFTCRAFAAGTQCQKISTDSQYPVETGDTYYVHDDIGVRIAQANVPTNNLMGEVAARVP